jgi:hypothetical protein
VRERSTGGPALVRKLLKRVCTQAMQTKRISVEIDPTFVLAYCSLVVLVHCHALQLWYVRAT